MTEDAMTFNDEVNMGIGRVARAHVGAEYMLRQIWMNLVGPGEQGELWAAGGGHGFATLRDQCKARLKRLSLSEDLRAVAESVLDAAKSVNDDRNRAVHDMWLVLTPPDGDEVTITRNQFQRGSVLPVPTPTDLDWLHGVEAKIRRVEIRLSALHWLLMPYIGWLAMGDFEDPMTANHLETARDEFDVLENGASRVWSARPSP